MDMTFDTESISIEVLNSQEVAVEATEIDITTVLDNFSVSDIVNHFNADELMDEIGDEGVRAWAEANGLIDEE